MKKIFTFLLASLVICFAYAQTPQQFTGSLLWKVSGNGLENTSYIFGTYHLYGSELLDSVPELKQAIESTTQVVGEMDTAKSNELQLTLMMSAMLPEDESYKTLLTEEEYTRLDSGLSHIIGQGLKQFESMRPGMINTMLAILLHSQTNPESNLMELEAIDSYLQRIALETGKNVIGLETIEDQINALFFSKPQRDQMLDLLCLIENWEYSLNSMRFLSEHYITGDVYAIYLEAFDNEKDPCSETYDENSKNALLKNRNDNWMKQLPSIMQEASTLVAVGALHLAGEEGLLYQLHKLGYTVEAVKNKD